jgi:hypothetical protein
MVILAPWEAKIRRIEVSLGKNFVRPNHNQIAEYCDTYLSSHATQEAGIRRITIPGQPRP